MKKLLIGLGITFLVIIVLSAVFGGFAFVKINNMMPSIERCVNDFYSVTNNENYNEVYSSMTDDKFKKASSLVDFKKFMGAVYRKLGKERFHVKGGYSLNYMSDGIYFSVEYSTTREKGKAIEDFVLRRDKITSKWLLVDYKINSKELVQN